MLCTMLLPYLSAAVISLPPQHPPPSAEEQVLIDTVRPEKAREHLQKLTARPHIAGSPADLDTARYVQRVLDQAGFETEIEEFQVLLSQARSVSLEVDGRPLDLREQPSP